MWIALWAVASAIILGITAWSFAILQQQKRAWKAFATRHKLEYIPGKTMASPTMRGRVGDHFLSFFTGQEQTNDARGQRFVTIIEIDLRCGLPTAAAIGTAQTRTFVNALRLEFDFVPPPGTEDVWSPDYVGRTRSADKLKAYMTRERMAVLHSLFQMKNAVVLFFFDELDSLIRIETNDPLRDDKKIEKIVNRLLADLGKLAPTDEERALTEKERLDRQANAASDAAVQRAAERALAAAAVTATAKQKQGEETAKAQGPYLLQDDKEPK